MASREIPPQPLQYNHLQHSPEILPARGNGRLGLEGEPSAFGNGGAVQGALQYPHYDVVNYPPPPGDLRLAVQYTYFPKGPENTGKSFSLRINRMASLAMQPTLLLALSRALTKPRLLIHLLTPDPPLLTSHWQRERISNGWPAVMCAIQLHGLI